MLEFAFFGVMSAILFVIGVVGMSISLMVIGGALTIVWFLAFVRSLRTGQRANVQAQEATQQTQVQRKASHVHPVTTKEIWTAQREAKAKAQHEASQAQANDNALRAQAIEQHKRAQVTDGADRQTERKAQLMATIEAGLRDITTRAQILTDWGVEQLHQESLAAAARGQRDDWGFMAKVYGKAWGMAANCRDAKMAADTTAGGLMWLFSTDADGDRAVLRAVEWVYRHPDYTREQCEAQGELEMLRGRPHAETDRCRYPDR